MPTVTEVITRHRSAILERWAHGIRREPFAHGLTPVELSYLMPAYLSTLGRGTVDAPARVSKTQQELLEHHLSGRIRQGARLQEIQTEFAVLRRCIAGVISGDDLAVRLPHPDVAQLFTELHLASVAVTKLFSEHLLEDEQTEKHFARMLQTVASEAAPAEWRMKEALGLIMRAMGADAAAVLLLDADGRRLTQAVATGDADTDQEPYVCSRDVTTLAGKIASRELEPTAVIDAATTELDVGDALRRSGIHALLGVCLSARHTLRGVMYVGLRERRAFTATETRRLESLAAVFTIHLENALLLAVVRKKADEIAAESELRERFVAVLNRDLAGPLAAAQASTQKLLTVGDETTRAVARGVAENLDRMRETVAGLLKAQRIRAAHRDALSNRGETAD